VWEGLGGGHWWLGYGSKKKKVRGATSPFVDEGEGRPGVIHVVSSVQSNREVWILVRLPGIHSD